MEVQITKFRMVNKGCLKAFLDLNIDLGDLGSIQIRNCRLIQEPAKKMWFTPPQSQFTDSNGELKFATLAKFKGQIKEAVERTAIGEYISLNRGDVKGRDKDERYSRRTQKYGNN